MFRKRELLEVGIPTKEYYAAIVIPPDNAAMAVAVEGAATKRRVGVIALLLKQLPHRRTVLALWMKK